MSRNVYTVRQFAERNPAFTQSSLRNLIFQSRPRESCRGAIDGNGLASAIIRIGGKILIDEDAFYSWVEAHRGGRDE